MIKELNNTHTIKAGFMTAFFVILILSSLHTQESAAPTGPLPSPEIIGRSVQGRPLEMYRIGSGPRRIILIGGIHGGYEWNTIVLVRELLQYFSSRPELIPEQITLHIIPNMNPDGLHRITGSTPPKTFNFAEVDTVPGRFNGNYVDLNRNWDHEWEETAYWGRQEVHPGEAPFSEPETRSIRDIVHAIQPASVVFYHSAANGIYYGGKDEGWAPSLANARAYHEGSGYPLPEPGDGGLVTYPITGAASNYFHKKGIPSMVIELSTHHRSELERNIKGLGELFNHIASDEVYLP